MNFILFYFIYLFDPFNRIRTFSFPEVVQQFDFKTLKKKKSVVQDHSLRNMCKLFIILFYFISFFKNL